MADQNANRHTLLNVALALAIALLVGLVIYGNRFRNEVAQSNAMENTPRVVPPTPQPLSGPPPPLPNPLADAIHPPAPEVDVPRHVTGELSDSIEQMRALKNQTRQLRIEASAQGRVNPEDKRALALSNEEIEKLEKDGDAIF